MTVALESAHAIWAGFNLAKTLPKESDLVIVSVLSSHPECVTDL